jgi:hypothetical protein
MDNAHQDNERTLLCVESVLTPKSGTGGGLWVPVR